MLISRRKEGESVLIGEDIEIRIIDIRKRKVILGIIAPRDLRIAAARLNETELANTMAAANSIELADLLPMQQEQVLFLLERSKECPAQPISNTESQPDEQ
jgi:carbon storage regulator